MFGKLWDFLKLFRRGEEVCHTEFWKGAQRTGQPILAGLLTGTVALMKGTKYEIPLDDATALLIAGGIFAAVNWVLTTITTKTLGVVPDKPSKANVPSAIGQAIASNAILHHNIDATLLAEARAALERDRGRKAANDGLDTNQKG